MEISNGVAHMNGHSDHHKERKRETSEERRIRKEKEKNGEKRRETEEERRIRKEKEKQEGKRRETSEERRIRKEKEKNGEKRKETEEERRIRKEKEKNGEKRKETEEERRIRKEKEKQEGKRRETSEERRIRKEKEKRAKENETEEERRIRKEKERSKKHETEEERAARKERERKEKKQETEEERAARKERERRERKEKEKDERRPEIKEEMELGDDYFAAEEARLNEKRKIKEEEDQMETNHVEESYIKDEEMDIKEEDESCDEDEPQGIIREPVEQDSDDDVPLAKRKKPPVKRKVESGDESDDEPLAQKRARMKMEQEDHYYEDEEEFRPSKTTMKNKLKNKKKTKEEQKSPKKQTKKEKELEAETKVWKWWEEGNQLPEGVKWRFLEHKGPMFAPLYEPLPEHVRFWYDGKTLRLTEETEEAATFYGKMLDHDYTTKEVFNKNFFKDWRKIMTEREKEIIRDLSICDFSEINEHFKKVSEERKNRSKEEKKAEKEKNDAIVAEMGFCSMDGHQERIGNFRTEPPSLFRGRGEHPKQGMIKRRIVPEDVIINCSKDSAIPVPPEGHKWKKVQHDNTVTWLASWTENIQGQIKYIMLNPSSKLKGEKDWAKYEKARKLKGEIGKIRDDYMEDMKSKEMRLRQRAVALYFIDKLALRAGNEKDEDQADTVGCCSLRVEHLELHDQKDGKENVVEFDFLGKDSIRYYNEVAVEKKVFKNLRLFMENKKDGDDLFDRLNTSILNTYLNSLMDGLTAKVFRTYNASFTLQQQLDALTNEDDNIAAKMLSYNRANREVAVLCNHQRAVPKGHEKSMENLAAKIEAKHEAIKDAEKKLKHAKKAYKNGNGGNADKANAEKAKKTLERLLEQLEKLEIQRTDRDENKTIALGTSKLNYLDPRISVAWCKKHEVPIEKVYNKTQREKFRWAIDMIMNDDEEYHF